MLLPVAATALHWDAARGCHRHQGLILALLVPLWLTTTKRSHLPGLDRTARGAAASAVLAQWPSSGCRVTPGDSTSSGVWASAVSQGWHCCSWPPPVPPASTLGICKEVAESRGWAMLRANLLLREDSVMMALPTLPSSASGNTNDLSIFLVPGHCEIFSFWNPISHSLFLTLLAQACQYSPCMEMVEQHLAAVSTLFSCSFPCKSCVWGSPSPVASYNPGNRCIFFLNYKNICLMSVKHSPSADHVCATHLFRP